MTFDYRDPKAISAVSLSIDSPLEPIIGWAKGISGQVRFDPARPAAASGTILVDVDSVTFANEGYTATARSYALNGKKWPRLRLTIRRVERVRKVSATRYQGVVLADFTCRGITRPKRLNVTADYLPGRAEERTNGQHRGDLLVLRTKFEVSRKAHGISEGIPDAMVGDRIEVGVALVGIHYRPEKRTAEKKAVALRVTRPVLGPDARDLPLARIGGGADLSLNAARGGHPLVAIFLNEECGVSIYYRARLRALVRDYAAKGFRFVVVRAGRKLHPGPVDLPERRDLAVPFLDDAGGDLMRRYEIGQSFTAVVLDRSGATRYVGGIDDHVDPRRVRRTPLRDALNDLAAGRPVRTARFRTLGCAILPVEG